MKDSKENSRKKGQAKVHIRQRQVRQVHENKKTILL